ncbi:hypothetical protein F5878DRAFT_499593, partial [Lentinula raphanica]
VYAFFEAEPEIEFENNGVTPKYLIYTCSLCAIKIKQGCKTADKGSTGNLSTHGKKCWGEEAFNAAKDSTLAKARQAVKTFGKKGQGRLTLALKTTKGWAKLNSTRPPEKETIRSVHLLLPFSLSSVEQICSVVTARWVAENARPFRVVQDRSYRWLQKEGRPNHYVPSEKTVARDLKKLYGKVRERLAEELQINYAHHWTQNCEYKLALALDCWTSPNHHAYMSIIV